MKTQFLAFALMAASALAKDCGSHGTLTDNCCVCDAGYSGPSCTDCAPGYQMLNGECGNGRAGTTCSDEGAFPFFGCGGAGECSIDMTTSMPVFPCVCKDLQGNVVACATKIIEQTTCAPRGGRMYVPFPNEPRIEHPFSLTVVTCGVTSPKLMMVPAFKEDGITSNNCSSRVGDMGGLPSECVLSNDPDSNSTIPESCKEGIVLDSLYAELQSKDMAEHTFAGLNVSRNNFYINGQDNLSQRKQFKVCISQEVPVTPGSQQMETIWVPVDGHNSFVSARDQAFELAEESDIYINGAALGSADSGDCCDGLKIGFCLPLWAFLLLWLLMALCLGMLGFLLHKNKAEIEAKRNNEKYEKFNTDAEMIEHAAKEADDDDI